MKKLLCKFIKSLFFSALFLCITVNLQAPKKLVVTSAKETTSTLPLIALVIDDFGSLDRGGVEEMLALDVPLTCAIMPALENSVADAEKAHAKGHEVILHMPMEALANLPRDWYGPKMIHNHDTPEVAVSTINECMSSIPHSVGMNIHIGTGVSSNEKIISAIMKELKAKGKYFLDSKTTESTKCKECAVSTKFNLMTRDIFIENHNNHSYAYAMQSLQGAIQLAKKQGYAVVIGHVGPEGGMSTVRAISDSKSIFEKEGIRLVKLSEIAKLTQKSV